ncbi:MAG: hypothetical protein CM1200mP6_02740 [Anaerolineaceae bacterium]|nr:MAG: hypothetical protein CM1200mP6_02740 [Anaerolineaceae bacterium]
MMCNHLQDGGMMPVKLQRFRSSQVECYAGFHGSAKRSGFGSFEVSTDRHGINPNKINPMVPVDIVIDHSVQVDYFGNGLALTRNAEMEFKRNGERYACLAWASNDLTIYAWYRQLLG